MMIDSDVLREKIEKYRDQAAEGRRHTPRGNDFEAGYETGQSSMATLCLRIIKDMTGEHEEEG